MKDRRPTRLRSAPGPTSRSTSSASAVPTDVPPERPRFLSEADCYDIGHRLARFAQEEGETVVTIFSQWRGQVRWARNHISTSGEDRNDTVICQQMHDSSQVWINQTTDAALMAASHRAERLARFGTVFPEHTLMTLYAPEPVSAPSLFSEATYQLDATHRAEAAHALAQSAAAAGMLSAGYIEVAAHSLALVTSWGYTRYFRYTWARYSVTVRDPAGTGSGWAGVDWPDWSQIDAPALSAVALDKCLTSRHPVAVEPGRYTVILEPQAVCDFVGELVFGDWTPSASPYQALDRVYNQENAHGPFNKVPSHPGAFPSREGVSLLGERVVDERITISADPMDPELRFPPFPNMASVNGDLGTNDDVYHPVTWIERGVLMNLSYWRGYGVDDLGVATGLPKAGAFRMSGGPTTIAEMIATTQRGLLVTRFDRILPLDFHSLLMRGVTRDGLWLIEQGKVTKAVKNMVFTESILFSLNSLEQLGPPQRAFHPPGDVYASIPQHPQPVIVPPLKVRDFSFTSLTNTV